MARSCLRTLSTECYLNAIPMNIREIRAKSGVDPLYASALRGTSKFELVEVADRASATLVKGLLQLWLKGWIDQVGCESVPNMGFTG
jgi:hypothetical protein